MNVVGERFHVGELVVGADIAFLVACALPGVIDVHVHITGVAHAVSGHGIGNFPHSLVVNLAMKVVPAVTSHRRRARQTVVSHCMYHRRSDLRKVRKGRNGSWIGRCFGYGELARSRVCARTHACDRHLQVAPTHFCTIFGSALPFSRTRNRYPTRLVTIHFALGDLLHAIAGQHSSR